MSRTRDIDLTILCPVTVGGDDDWDWTSVEPERADEVVARLDAPDLNGTHVGLAIYHPQAATGGNLLFFPDRNTVAFTPAIHRREVAEGIRKRLKGAELLQSGVPGQSHDRCFAQVRCVPDTFRFNA